VASHWFGTRFCGGTFVVTVVGRGRYSGETSEDLGAVVGLEYDLGVRGDDCGMWSLSEL
jgi:hypothetical protein